MSVEAAIVSLLREPTSELIEGRIAPAVMPERLRRPNVVYQVLTTRRTYSNSGPTGLARATLQLTCYADDYKAAKGLARAVREALNGFRGEAAAGDSGTVNIQSLLLNDERDAPTPPPAGQSAVVHGVVMVFAIAYGE